MGGRSGERAGLAARVERARRGAGMTVEELSEATDIPQRTLARRLQHPLGFSLDELVRIADATHANDLAADVATLTAPIPTQHGAVA